MVNGHLITFEGSEGAGKTTQISLLLEKLEEHGVPFLLTREPGGTALGESIRHLLKFSGPEIKIYPIPELLLFCASRAQLVSEVIRPALQQGRVVVCDRFFDSTVVYQCIARGIGLKHVDALRELTLGDVWPKLTFVLDIDPTTARQRALRRTQEEGHDPDRIEAEPLEFYQKISAAYRQLAADEPARVRVIPANKQAGEIAAEIWPHVAYALKL